MKSQVREKKRLEKKERIRMTAQYVMFPIIANDGAKHHRFGLRENINNARKKIDEFSPMKNLKKKKFIKLKSIECP